MKAALDYQSEEFFGVEIALSDKFEPQKINNKKVLSNRNKNRIRKGWKICFDNNQTINICETL